MRVMLETCDVVGERAQLNLVWVSFLGVRNASHLRRFGITNVMP